MTHPVTRFTFIAVPLLTLMLSCSPLPGKPPVRPTPTITLTAITRLTATPYPTHTAEPIAIARPTSTACAELNAPPILITDAAKLPDLLRTSTKIEPEEGLAGHSLFRVAKGDYSWRDIIGRPYRWLDSTHLLLFPVFAEETGQYASSELAPWSTQPVVVSLSGDPPWVPPAEPFLCDREPPWSDALQALVIGQGDDVLLLDASGRLIRRLSGGGAGPLHLAPSGQRLLSGRIWRDLETGREVIFPQGVLAFGDPAWSADENRLFACCFTYVDANLVQWVDFDELQERNTGSQLRAAGRGMYCDTHVRSQWVSGDTRVLVEYDLRAGDDYHKVLPLIDPQTQTYEELLESDQLLNFWIWPAPDGKHVVIDNRFLVDLHTQAAPVQQLPGNPDLPSDPLCAIGWSPDGQFLALEGQDGKMLLLSMDGSLRLVAEELVTAAAWSPDGKHLALLTADRRTLVLLDLETWDSHQVPLPESSCLCEGYNYERQPGIIWNPSGDSLAIIAEDATLWYLPDLAANSVEPLTPPLPALNVHWSPDGQWLAFTSGQDIYIVSATDSTTQ